MSGRRLDASALRDWAHTAVDALIAHTDEINRLNVFPVADADTGTNMLFTMRSALAQAQKRAQRIDREAGSGDVAGVAAALADGALHGARGNSGVILSQILRGLADVTAAAAADAGQLANIDVALFGAALRHGVGLVVTSLGEAVPGTIVSVLQAAATAAEEAGFTGADLAAVTSAAADAAAVALDKTPEQLDVLGAAGVVDAGGRGLLVLLDALNETLTGHLPVRHRYPPAAAHRHPETPEAAPARFEVMYLLAGCADSDMDTLRVRLEELGDSVVIAASGPTGQRGASSHSVHVHADDAGAVVEAGLAVGTASRIQITALTGRVSTPWLHSRAVLAIVDGDGAAELFAAEGACVLRRDSDTGAREITANQLLRAFVDTGAGQVLVLPNGYVAAEELVAGCAAANGWGIDVVPVPAGSMVQGLAAVAVHDPGRESVNDGYTMARAAGATRYGSVRMAAEDALTWAGPCRRGDGLGIAGDEVLVVRHDVVAAGRGLIDLMLAAGGELITVLTGEGVDTEVGDLLSAHVRHFHLGAELVTYHTGHGGDALIIGVE